MQTRKKEGPHSRGKKSMSAGRGGQIRTGGMVVVCVCGGGEPGFLRDPSPPARLLVAADELEREPSWFPQDKPMVKMRT